MTGMSDMTGIFTLRVEKHMCNYREVVKKPVIPVVPVIIIQFFFA
jgi:hypothetical protein